jgi:hypothetical protein
MATLPDEPDELSADMAEAIAALHLLGDEELWRAGRQYLAPEKSSEIEELHRKRQRDGLSASELEALATLMKEYTRIMLVRARSAALLKQRGHDVSGLCAEHEPWLHREGASSEPSGHVRPEFGQLRLTSNRD